MEISKPIVVIPGKSWILVYEHIGGSLILERVVLTEESIINQRIRFSRQTVEKILPAITDWLERKNSIIRNGENV